MVAAPERGASEAERTPRESGDGAGAKHTPSSINGSSEAARTPRDSSGGVGAKHTQRRRHAPRESRCADYGATPAPGKAGESLPLTRGQARA